MKNKKDLVPFYLGLDIGTDSVGYAVTDESYNLLRFHGQDAWGAHVFDQASLNDERRNFRNARRRLDRRQQRVLLLQELFAPAVEEVDSSFFKRIRESYLYRDDCDDNYVLFNDENYTDVDFYREYPTIHHLLKELMENDKPHDVRLVYLACSWLVSHRGHFFSNISKDNIDKIKDFDTVYERFMSFFTDNGFRCPWGAVDIEKFSETLKTRMGVNNKYKQLVNVLNGGKNRLS